MKKLFVSVIACFLSVAALAGEVVVTWTSSGDPTGWNLYMNHLQTPDALQYLGTLSGENRTTTFHNISDVGLYQFGVSRVRTVNDNGVTRRVESPIRVFTVLNGVVIATPNGVSLSDVTFTP